MTGDIESVTAASVAQALASDYFSIYYVNTETDRFIEYSASSAYQDLGIETNGDDFFELSRKNIMRVIYPEDRDMFLQSFTKEKVLATLFAHPTFTLTYRLMFGDKPTYVHMKATRMKDRDDNHIVIGVSNIDEQMKAEAAYAESRAKALTYSRIAQALAEDYFSIYYVDMLTDRFIEYSSHASYDDLGIEKDGEDFFNLSRRNIERVMEPEDRGAFLAAFTKENIQKVLDENRAFTLTYRLLFNGVPTWVSMKATRMKEGDGDHIIIGVNNIDAQMKQQEAYIKASADRVTYGRIAQALAGDYFSIYCVDPDTDHFIEYSATDVYDSLNIEKGGEDFFNLSRRNILKHIYPEDRDKLLAAFTKENLMNEMRSGVFTINYRLIFDGQPTHVSMKATLLEDKEGRHIIIGVNNIDAQMRREEEFTRNLVAARDMANRDALTGVKSKHAFNEAEEQLNRQIAEGKVDPFSVVVCDVNGLKTINDTQGHRAGDALIREACAIICNMFKHSPVFRIGGDEFTIITHGQDSDNIDALMAKFLTENEARKASGGVVIASGMARYNGDSSVQAVFERADAAMYENKKTLKDGETPR